MAYNHPHHPFSGLAIDMRCDYTTVKLAKENYGQGEETRVMNASDLSSSEFSVPSQGASSDSYHRSETEAKTSILSYVEIERQGEREKGGAKRGEERGREREAGARALD
eukprot:939732-Amorphochlora_amoeboformis.AAC.1